MKVLLISPNYPFPADKGDRIRVNSILRALLANKVEVDLFCLEKEGRVLPEADLDLKSCELFFIRKKVARLRMLLALFTGKSLTTAFFKESQLTARLQEADFTTYDRIVVCSSCLAFLIPLFESKDLSSKLIWDLIDLDSIKWRKLSVKISKINLIKKIIYKREAKLISKVEKEIVNLADRSLLITEREVDTLSKADRHRKNIHALPISVHPYGLGEATKKEKEINLIFTGQMDYFPNMEAVKYFANRVLPLIRSRLGKDIQLTVGGRNASKKFMEACPNCEFLTDVKDMSALVASARIAVIPLLSVFGLPTKTLEAMACDVPLVVSTEVAKALKLEDNKHALVADSPKDFADNVVSLMLDINLAKRLASEAGVLVHNQYSEEAIAERMKELL